jgi:hypothetical protein
MSIRLIAIASVLLAAAAAGRAAAQPGVTPSSAPPAAPYAGPYAPPPPPVELEEKSPGMALALSLGGTIGTIALASLGGDDGDGNPALGTIGALGLWVAPSFGHWYAGDGWTTGLSYRLGGTGAILVGAIWAASSCNDGVDDGTSRDDDCEDPGLIVAGGGAIAFVGGIIYDIATAPRAARQHNERQRARLQGLALQPAISRDHTGFALSGRF